MTTYIKQCTECKGFGYTYVPDDAGTFRTKNCPTCAGAGAKELVDCPDCGAVGKPTCKLCSGTGRIDKLAMLAILEQLENGK